MRTILIALVGAGLGGCSTAPEAPTRSAEMQAKYLKAIEGKVAGTPMSCLPSWDANDMQVIDDQTVVFREGSRRVFVGTFNGSCDNIGQPGYALVTRRSGGSGMCSGDIATVVQTSTGITSGSCVIGSFTPYATP